MATACEREFCAHHPAEHDRSRGSSSTVCRRCPCSAPIVNGQVVDPRTPSVQPQLFDGGKSTVVQPPPPRRTVDDSERDLRRLIEYYDGAPEYQDRLKRARTIAVRLALQKGDVTVADVRDVFEQTYGKQAWLDERGTTYWAGAIFRDKVTWDRVTRTRSPYNNSDGNGVWKLKEEIAARARAAQGVTA